MNDSPFRKPNEPRRAWTAGDLVQGLRRFRTWFSRNSMPIALLAVLGGSSGAGLAWWSDPMYTARTTFVFKEDHQSSLLAGLSGIGNMLGMSAPGSGTGSLDRIVELAGSHLLVGKALLHSVRVGKQEDLLINHLINIQELRQRKAWREDSMLRTVQFDHLITYENLSLSQRKAMNWVIAMVRGNGQVPSELVRVHFDKKSSVIHLQIKHRHELFAYEFNRALYTELVNFYTLQATQNLSTKVNTLQAKVDSIQNILNVTQTASAQSSDQGLGLLLQSDKVRQKRLNVRENILIMMYGEAVKNLEQLNFLLSTTTPSFSVIDQTYLPIKPYRRSWIGLIVLGLCAGAALGMLVAGIRDLFGSTKAIP
ncbi:MAG: hypothetical protein ACKOAV_07730 [Bacteroidota bacterium]